MTAKSRRVPAAAAQRAVGGAVVRSAGFTLVELMVALAVAALMAGLAVPMAAKAYVTMQYRDAVRGVASAATAARYQAVNTGEARDLLVAPDMRRYGVQIAGTAFEADVATLVPEALSLEVKVARQLVEERGVGVIRFYPDGSSTGGSVTIMRENGDGQRIRVDWLLGRVTHESPQS